MDVNLCGPKFRSRYDLRRKLGQGGMGSVYLALDERLDRFLAVKFISDSLHDEAMRARFLEEAKVLSRLHHRHIVQLFDYDDDDGHPFMAFEFIEGCTLTAFIGENGPPPMSQTKLWLSQICQAMQSAHNLGIIHRDLKSDNILLDEKGNIHISDFGLAFREDRTAALTEDGSIFGTPDYMAPELMKGQKATASSDLYAVGVVAFELFTGKRPFQGEGVVEVLQAHMKQPIPQARSFRKELPSIVDNLLLRLLAKDPKARFHSFQECQDELVNIADVPIPEEQSRTITTKLKALSTPAILPVKANYFTKYGKWILTLVIVFLLALLAVRKEVAKDQRLQEAKVESSSAGFSLQWQSKHAKRYSFVLKDSFGKTIKQVKEERSKNEHHFPLQGLSPDRDYSIVISDDDHSYVKKFKTPKLVFTRGVLACSWRRRVFIDFATNWWSNLTVVIKSKDETLRRKVSNEATLVMPKERAIKSKGPYRWSIEQDDRVLLSGTVIKDFPTGRLQRLFDKPYESVVDHRPLFMGTELIAINVDGVVTCLEACRHKDNVEPLSQSGMKVNWSFAPAPKAILGLTRYGKDKILVSAHHMEKKVRDKFTLAVNKPAKLWCLSTKERKAQPRKPRDWTLSSGEWQLDLPELRGCQLSTHGLVVDDVFYVQVLRRDLQIGYCAIDLKAAKVLWLAWQTRRIQDVPLYWSHRKEWSTGSIKRFQGNHFTVSPVVFGKRIYGVTNYTWPDYEHIVLVSSFTFGRDKPKDLTIDFAFNKGENRGRRLCLDEGSQQLLMSTRNALLCLKKGKRMPHVIDTDSYGGAKSGLIRRFLACSPVTTKEGIWFFLHERRLERTVIDSVYMDMYSCAILNETNSWSSNDVRFACEKEPGLFDIIYAGNHIITRAIEKLICIDVKTKSATDYSTKGGLQRSVDALEGDFRISAITVNDEGTLAAAITKFGVVEIIPLDLLTAGKQKLSFSTR